MPAPTDIPLGAPVWLDLQSSDTARSIEFYTGVFGWTHEQAAPITPQTTKARSRSAATHSAGLPR